jgi:hypothetical protein
VSISARLSNTTASIYMAQGKVSEWFTCSHYESCQSLMGMLGTGSDMMTWLAWCHASWFQDTTTTKSDGKINSNNNGQS